MEKYSLPTRIYSGEDSLTQLETLQNERLMLVCDLKRNRKSPG